MSALAVPTMARLSKDRTHVDDAGQALQRLVDGQVRFGVKQHSPALASIGHAVKVIEVLWPISGLIIH